MGGCERRCHLRHCESSTIRARGADGLSLISASWTYYGFGGGDDERRTRRWSVSFHGLSTV